MKRTLSIILALCMLFSCAVFFTGCSSDSSKDFPVTYGDVTIEKEPEAIVVLNDSYADILSVIGYDVKMVGRSEECDQEFLHVVPTMGTSAAPDTAAIISAETDLVIADSTLGADAKSALEAAEIKVVTMEPATDEETLKTLYADLGTVIGGNVTGKEKGEQGYDDLFKMLDNLNTASSDIVQSAAYLYLNENGQLCTFVKGSLEYKFFNYNGCSNVLHEQETAVINTEDLRIDTPTYLFYDSPEVLDKLSADENTAGIAVLSDGKALQIEKKNFSRYGASSEEAVFTMMNFIEKDLKGTEDEATPDYTPTTAAAASSAADTSSAADASSSAASAPAASSNGDEEVITFEDPATTE